MYSVKFHPQAKEEFDALEGRQKNVIIKKIQQLRANPHSGEELGNKSGFDLTGYRKTYVDKKKLRIVYSIQAKEVTIYIISIGKREDLAAYKAAFFRR